MRLLLFFAVFLFETTHIRAQIEVPETPFECKLIHKNNFTACLHPKNYNTQWTAAIIKASDIENKNYLPSDRESFKDIPPKEALLMAKIEQQTRLWALEFDSVYVVTGIVQHTADSTTEPIKAYYKAVLKGCQGDGLGFWIEEGTYSKSIKDCAISIDSLESKTNIDFWPSLNKDLQEIFEAEFSWQFWPVSIE